MPKTKRVDPIKQREKRAKIAAIAGAVLFLGVAAYEVPSVMKMMNQKPPPGANATDAGNRNPDGSIALPNVAVSTGLTGKGQLADTDVPPQGGAGQLVTFSMFQTKNPFVPQVSDAPAADTSASPTTTTADTSTTPTTTTPAPLTTPAPSATPTPPMPTPTTVVPAAATATTPTATTPTVAAPPTVAIKVNGVASRVGSDGTFPTGSPVFRLVSFTKTTAQIGIVGGSYATGDATLTLHLHQPVTLENQTDGKRYTLELIAGA
ncbi:MAG TPA: hypothetical protein VI408_02715 [Gaiellaceae bacterium]